MSSSQTPKSLVFNVSAASKAPGPGSDRTFGFFFAVLAAGIGAYGLWKGSANGWWGIGIGALLAVAAAVAPGSLHWANRLWFRLGMLLARVVNPLVIGAMFFLVITPMGLLMRAFGKRPLSLDFDKAAPSYWVERTPHGPAPQSMRDQF